MSEQSFNRPTSDEERAYCQALGTAVRKLGKSPSTDWANGFEEGYESKVKVKSLSEIRIEITKLQTLIDKYMLIRNAVEQFCDWKTKHFSEHFNHELDVQTSELRKALN